MIPTTATELTYRELLPLYCAARAWQRAHKAYAQATRCRNFPPSANTLLDTLLEAETNLLAAVSANQRGTQFRPIHRTVRTGQRCAAPTASAIQKHEVTA